jgi:hypothetical protein
LWHDHPDHKADGAEDERSSENARRNLVDVLAVAPLEKLDYVDPADRGGHRSEREPERQTRVDVPKDAVTPSADRLEDRTVEDVRPDGEDHLEVEDEHEDRRQ